jgi:glycosyltransferase involved in cell wall biosynthesis
MKADAGPKVLILCNYPLDHAPGQRFRFEQYLQVLDRAGIDVKVDPFFPPWIWPILWKPGNVRRKAWAVLRGFARRLWLLRRARQYDSIFIHLEAAPIGPPVIEWALFRLGCRVIYDIDDAIFIARTSKANRIVSPFRFRWKVGYVASRCQLVTACNTFLVEWARKFNPNVMRLPTTIVPAYYERRREPRGDGRPVIGWIGSHSTADYVDIVRPALVELQEEYDFEFRVICNVKKEIPEIRNYRFVPWTAESEIAELAKFDIGLMPVPDGLWAKGKVGLKAIQYSGLGIVPVASSVGSGPEVVRHHETGLLVGNTSKEWYDALAWLLTNRHLWPGMGLAARNHVVEEYSVAAQSRAYVELFVPRD